MAALAAEGQASPPGARGLVFLPYFSGERTPIHDPNAKGAIVATSSETSDPTSNQFFVFQWDPPAIGIWKSVQDPIGM